ncbi:MAG: hypothetical protein HY548_03025, partial [Elusimicrobia bacterium]|nr:hypothetical protein [Elusimicrobiota bacterium]
DVLSTTMTYTGQLGLEILMKILNIPYGETDAEHQDALKELWGRLNGATVIIKDKDKNFKAGYKIDYNKDTGIVTLTAIKADGSTDTSKGNKGVLGTFNINQVSWDSATLTLGAGSDGKSILNFSANIYEDGKVKATFNIGLATDDAGKQIMSTTINYRGQYALDLLMELIDVDDVDALWGQLNGAEIIINGADGAYAGGYRITYDSATKTVTILALKREETGKDKDGNPIYQYVVDKSKGKNGVLSTFKTSQVDWSTAILSVGKDSEGNAVLSFSADVRDASGKKYAVFSVSLSTDDAGVQTLSTVVVFKGEYAKNLLLKMLGVTEQQLAATLNGAVMTVTKNGQVVGAYKYVVDDKGNVTVFKVKEGTDTSVKGWEKENVWEEVKGAAFNINEIDWSTATLTLGVTNEGKSVMGFTAEIRRGGAKIGTLGVSYDADGKTLSYTVTYAGRLGLEILMRILNIDPGSANAIQQLGQALNGAVMTVVKNGKVVGAFMFEVKGDNVTVKTAKVDGNGNLLDAGDHVIDTTQDGWQDKVVWEAVADGSFNLSEVNWDSGSLTLGISSDGKTIMNYQADVRKEGARIGTFGVSYNSESDAITTAVTYKGQLGLEILMKVLGIDYDKTKPEQAMNKLWGMLNGAEVIIKDKDGNFKSGYKIEYNKETGEVTMWALMKKSDGSAGYEVDKSKGKDGKLDSFNISQVDWSSSALTLGAGSDGKTVMTFTADIAGGGGKDKATFNISLSTDDSGKQTLSTVVTYKGEYALTLLMQLIGVNTQEELWTQLNGAEIIINDKDGNFAGGYRLTYDSATKTVTIYALKREQVGEKIAEDGKKVPIYGYVVDTSKGTKGVLGTFGTNQVDLSTAILTVGKDSDGKAVLSFTADIRDVSGKKIAALSVSLSTDDQGKQTISTAIVLKGEYAKKMLLTMLDVDEAGLADKLDDAVMTVTKDGKVVGAYKYEVDDEGNVTVFKVKAGTDTSVKGWEGKKSNWEKIEGASFNISEIDWSSASLTLGVTNEGNSVMSFTADIRRGGAKIGTLGVSYDSDGKTLSYTVTYAGRLGLEILMSILNIDTTDWDAAKKQLAQSLNGAVMTIAKDGKVTGAYKFVVTGDNVQVFAAKVNAEGKLVDGSGAAIDTTKDKWQDKVVWEEVKEGSFKLSDVDWDSGSLTLGVSSDGKTLLNYSANIEKKGVKIGAFGVSFNSDSKAFSYTVNYAGELGRNILMQILGINPNFAGAEDRLWERLHEADIILNDKDGNFLAGYRITYDGKSKTITISALKKVGAKYEIDTTKQAFNMSVARIDWSSASLTLGRSSDGKTLMNFSVDVRKNVSLTFGLSTDGQGRQSLSSAVVFKGSLAKERLLIMLGVDEQGLAEKLNGAVMTVVKDGEIIGAFKYVVTGGTVKIYSAKVDADGKLIDANGVPIDTAAAGWEAGVQWEEMPEGEFTLGELDWSTASLSLGVGAEGKSFMNFSVDIRRNGEKIGTFSLSYDADKKTLSTTVAYAGLRARNIFMKILGIDPASESADLKLAEKLNGAVMVVTKDNNIVGAYKYLVDAAGNV